MTFKEIWEKLFSRKHAQTVLMRRACAEDVRFIFELSILQAKRGHFNGDFSISAVRADLLRQIGCAVGNAPVPMPGRRNNAKGDVFVMTVGEIPIGFAFFLEELPGSWANRVELFMVALVDQYKGLGLGTTMIKTLLTRLPSKTVFARCFAPSTQMKTILQDVGFETVSISPGGTATLELHR